MLDTYNHVIYGFLLFLRSDFYVMESLTLLKVHFANRLYFIRGSEKDPYRNENASFPISP